MSASNQTTPSGSYNNVGTDYLSPKNTGADIGILDAAAGDEYARFDSSANSFLVDIIGEFTSATGVTIDGVLLKDGGATLTTALAVTSGGTGATSASSARTNLGLGTIATQDASSVTISGGTATLTSATITSATIATGTINTVTSDGSHTLILNGEAGSGIYLQLAGTNKWRVTGNSILPVTADAQSIGSVSLPLDAVWSSNFQLNGAPTYTVSGYSSLRSVNGSSSLSDVARGLCTLIADLKNAGMLG